MSKNNVPETDRLFDEIAGKLNELSGNKPSESPAERFEKLQAQLKKSQQDWKVAQTNMQERMQNFEQFSNSQNELSQEIRRLSTLLEQERQNNSKTAGDLAKALELNLKLQFDIEEVRTKASQVVAEERKHNQFLVEKNRSFSTELELSQAMNQEIRLELGKAREKFLQDQNRWNEEKSNIMQQLKQQGEESEATSLKLDENEHTILRLASEVADKSEEVRRQGEEIHALMEALKSFEEHSNLQNDSMRQLTSTAEKKLVELKLALDKKIIESNDYYSHLQQALTQIQILRQENVSLKDYIQKIAQLHQTAQNTSNSFNSSAHLSHVPAQHTPSANTALPSQSAPQTTNAAAAQQPAASFAEPAVTTATPIAVTSAPTPMPSAAESTTPAAPAYGSPMMTPSTPAFMVSSTPAPTPSGTPAPAWMPAGPVASAAPSNRPQPPPKPAPSGNSSSGQVVDPNRPTMPPKPRPPFPTKAASNH